MLFCDTKLAVIPFPTRVVNLKVKCEKELVEICITPCGKKIQINQPTKHSYASDTNLKAVAASGLYSCPGATIGFLLDAPS